MISGASPSPQTVAAIFAHPDDEALGAGATLARHADRGDTVRILILATGLAARGGPESAAIEALRDEARDAASALGAESVAFAEFLDNRMDSVPLHDVVQRVEAFLQEAQSSRIFTHHAGDLNVDHRIVHQAVLTACRPVPGALPVDILACEVNSSTEWASPSAAAFQPTLFIDAATTLDRKTAALKRYASELRPWPHPRSVDGVRALARWRGARCARDAAEAFMLCRKVEA